MAFTVSSSLPSTYLVDFFCTLLPISVHSSLFLLLLSVSGVPQEFTNSELAQCH